MMKKIGITLLVLAGLALTIMVSVLDYKIYMRTHVNATFWTYVWESGRHR